MIKTLLLIVYCFLLSVLGVFAVYVVIKTMIIGFSNRIPLRKKHHKLRFRYRHFLYHIRDTRYINIIEFIKWVYIDIRRGVNRFKLFGVWCFTGYYGQGKSLGAVNFAFRIKEKNPDKKIHIYSNFNVKGQDGKVTHWQDLLSLPPNTILIFDEIQSTFSSTKYSDFPIELLWKLTQCRKHGLAIFCTSPVFTRMSIQLRESTDFVIECKNQFKLDRWFKYKFYRTPQYEKLQGAEGFGKGLKERQLREFVYSLVAQDKNFKLYNTVEQIDRWDIEDKNESNKRIKRNDYKKLKEELLKEIEYRLKKAV